MVNWQFVPSHAMIEEYRGSDKMPRTNFSSLLGAAGKTLLKTLKENRNKRINEIKGYVVII